MRWRRNGAVPFLASVVILGVLALAVWNHVLKRWITRTVVRLSLYAGLLLAAAVAARLHPALGARPAAPPAETPALEPVALAVARDSVVAGEMVRVTFDRPIGMAYGYGYWITIVPRGAAVQAQGLRTDLKPGDVAAELLAPDEPGEYEVRLHPHMNPVLSSRPLVVLPRTTPRTRPDVELR